eukprot:2742549-Rhodomonas_salina.1
MVKRREREMCVCVCVSVCVCHLRGLENAFASDGEEEEHVDHNLHAPNRALSHSVACNHTRRAQAADDAKPRRFATKLRNEMECAWIVVQGRVFLVQIAGFGIDFAPGGQRGRRCLQRRLLACTRTCGRDGWMDGWMGWMECEGGSVREGV